MLACTILCENTAGRPGIIGEFGFSALIELGKETILFDTGSGKGIIPNCLALKKDLGHSFSFANAGSVFTFD